jgi:hypothetical protein
MLRSQSEKTILTISESKTSVERPKPKFAVDESTIIATRSPSIKPKAFRLDCMSHFIRLENISRALFFNSKTLIQKKNKKLRKKI